MSLTLFDLTEENVRLMQDLFDVEEAMQAATPADADALAAAEARLLDEFGDVNGQFVEKVGGYVHVIREFAARASVMKAEAEVYTEKAAVCERAARRIKDRLKAAMEMLGVDKLPAGHFTLALQNSPPSARLLVPEEQAVEAGYGEMVPKVDNRAIIAAFKADPASVEGIAEVTQGRHLRIR